MEVYVSFKDVFDYFDYLEKYPDRVTREYLPLATLMVDLQPEDIDALALDERVEYIEMVNYEPQEPAVIYNFNNGNESTSGHWDVPNVMSRFHEGYTGRGIKIAIIDNGFEQTHAPDGTLDVEYKEIKYFGSHRNADHGVGMGSIMGAKSNGVGIIGSAPEAELYGLNVISSQGTGMGIPAIIDALNWSIENKMDVVSMSLSGTYNSATYHNAIQNCYNNNIIVVAAAGNNASQEGTSYRPYTKAKRYPACYPEVITVSGCMYLEHSDLFVNQYNYNDSTNISMPVPRFGYQLKRGSSSNPLQDNGAFGASWATSGATAFTAGIVATIRQQYPGISRDAVLDLLLEDYYPVKDGLGRVPRLGLLDKGRFSVKETSGWRTSYAPEFDSNGKRGANVSANTRGALYTAMARAEINSPGAFNEDWSNAFRRWPIDAIPSFNDSRITNASRMFDQIRTGGTLNLAKYSFPNVTDCIYMFAGSTLDSLDISGITNTTILNEKTLFQNTSVRTLFVASEQIADKIWGNYYNNFSSAKLDFICIGPSGKESTYIYKANKVGHFRRDHLSSVDNENVSIVEAEGKHWFHSPSGRISVDLPDGFVDFASTENYLNRISVSVETPGRTTMANGTTLEVQVTAHHATKGSLSWSFSSQTTNLVAGNVKDSWKPSRISFYAKDGGSLRVSVNQANHFRIL